MRGKRNNHIGKRFGKLTVVRQWSEVVTEGRSKEGMLECLCDCGKTVIVPTRYVTNTHKQSCGCNAHPRNIKSKHWKGYGEIGGTVWNDIRRGAIRKSRTIQFCITIEQGWELFLKQNRKCALTGVPLSFPVLQGRLRGSTITASLDRIDSTKDYTIDNVQWVHKHINIMKWTLKQDEFIDWCNKVAIHHTPHQPIVDSIKEGGDASPPSFGQLPLP